MQTLCGPPRLRHARQRALQYQRDALEASSRNAASRSATTSSVASGTTTYPPRLVATFHHIADGNLSGLIYNHELRAALRHHGMDVTSAKAHHALLQYDSHPDGRVDLDEFAALVQHLERVGTTNHSQPPLSHPPVAVAAEPSPTILGAFRKFDLNSSGYLEYDELRMALAHYGIDVSSQAALSVLLSYDSNRDGRLDFEEFQHVVADILTLGSGRNAGAAPSYLRPFAMRPLLPPLTHRSLPRLPLQHPLHHHHDPPQVHGLS